MPGREVTPAHIEETLKVLCECGFKIVHPYSCEDILRLYEKLVDEGVLSPESNNVKTDAFITTLILLGQDYKDEDADDWEYEYGRCYCENLWYIDDFEAYDGCDETYLYIIERMLKMTGGALKLDNLKSWYFEEDGHIGKVGKVGISFEFQGKAYQFSRDCEKWFNNVDLFSPIVKLLEIADPTKIFAYRDIDCGETCAIICISKEGLEKLNEQRMFLKPLAQKFEKA